MQQNEETLEQIIIRRRKREEKPRQRNVYSDFTPEQRRKMVARLLSNSIIRIWHKENEDKYSQISQNMNGGQK